jgi:hypothetical protein
MQDNSQNKEDNSSDNSVTKIFFGVLAIILSIYTIVDASSVGFYWIGGILVGILLISSGMAERKEKRQHDLLVRKFVENQEEIESMFAEETPLLDMKEILWEESAIPPIKTLYAGGIYLLQKYFSDPENSRHSIENIMIPYFEIDNPDIDDLIDDFSTVQSVYLYLKNSVRSHQVIAGKEKIIHGSIIIHQEFLVFIPGQVAIQTSHGSGGGEIVEALEIGMAFLEVGLETNEEWSDSFDEPHKLVLKKWAKKATGTKIFPMRQITEITGYSFKKWYFKEEGLHLFFNINGIASEFYFSPQNHNEKWNSTIASVLEIACAVLGNFPNIH